MLKKDDLLSSAQPLPSSFRDPSGFVFRQEGLVYRRIAPAYGAEYRRLMDSGLYKKLTESTLLLPHEEIEEGLLLPQQLSFVSYPYEWSFSQWKDAALATLAIQNQALDHGMSLKDASTFNIQFVDGKPVLIDTLSFETYQEGEPWVAYRQFCEHFLAPLALMAKCDIRLGGLMRLYMDGIPLSLVAKLLPWQTRFSLNLLGHLYVQANLQERGDTSSDSSAPRPAEKMSLTGMRALLESLQSAVQGLQWEPQGTVWADYYEETNYTSTAMTAKEELVSAFLDAAGTLSSVWDFGANDARFSRLASKRGIPTVAFDIDPAAVEKAYRTIRHNNEANLLPLLLDLTNPSPDQGWAQEERMSLLARGPADAIIALALVHHLAIGNNVPLTRVADFFAAATKQWLIVEFVPKEDSQTQRLLKHRRDIFTDYTIEGFETAFSRQWSIVRKEAIPQTARTLYLLQKRDA